MPSAISLSFSKALTRKLLYKTSAINFNSKRHIIKNMATATQIEVYVKGDPQTKTLGDCPFCHRVLITLEQKNLKYNRDYIDFANKPGWLLNVNPSGTVPVMKDGEEWLTDSGDIVVHLEEKYPLPSVPANGEGMDAGIGIFGAFREYILNKDESKAETLKNNLENEIEKLNNYLKNVDGPFMGGKSFDAADAAILPRIYIAIIALGHYLKWEIPEKYEKVKEYVDRAFKEDVWKKTIYSKDLIIDGWGKKLES